MVENNNTIQDPIVEEKDGQMSLFAHEETSPEVSEEKIKEAVEETLSKVRSQSMLLGAQAICSVILEKIVKAESAPGKRTMNDYKRLIKDVKNFCTTGLSRKVNADGTTESIDNNTKLMEESNESNINQSNGEPDSSN